MILFVLKILTRPIPIGGPEHSQMGMMRAPLPILTALMRRSSFEFNIWNFVNFTGTIDHGFQIIFAFQEILNRNTRQPMKPKKPYSETELRWKSMMIQIQEGNEKIYELFLEEVSYVLKPFCISRIGGFGNIDDCVQEILIGIHHARHTYDPNHPIKPWLFAIARYKMIDWSRKKIKISSREVFDEQKMSHAKATDVNPDHQMGVSQSLENALNKLDEKYKEVIICLKLQELSVKETADKLGISESNVKARASRGYKKLKSILEKQI